MTKCEFCGSDQTIVSKRGFNIITGFIGSSKLMVTCLKCGCKKPLKPKTNDYRNAKNMRMFKSTLLFLGGIFLLVLLIGILRQAGLT